MAIIVPTAPKLVVGAYNLANNATMINWGTQVETKDVTTWGMTPFRQFVAGLKVMMIDVGGYNDFTTVTGADEYLRGIVGAGQQVLTLAPVGDTVGTVAQVTRGLIDTLQSFDGQVGNPSNLKLKVWGAQSILAEGQVTQSSSGTITATGNTSPVQVGALSAIQSMYAAVHVLSVTGTTPSATFQLASSATSGGAYTVRGSAGAAMTAAGAQWLTAAGAVTDTWWRLNVTVSGTTPVFTVLASTAVL